MPRGYPDYQNPVNQVAGRLVDFSGIQTAQLGLSTLDGLGRLVWVDQFHEGLSAWELDQKVAGLDPEIVCTISENPPSCCKLGLAGAAAGSASALYRSFQFTDPKTAGLDFSILANAGNNAVAVDLALIKDGRYHAMEVQYTPIDGTITVAGAAAGPLILTMIPTLKTHLWISIKLVVDFENSRGLRVLLLGQSFSLVDYVVSDDALAEPDQVYIALSAQSNGAGSLNQYIGHVYLTADEP